MRLNPRVLLAAAMLSVLPLAGCEDPVNKANFDRINTGMALHEVESIMGGKGEQETVTSGGISSAGIQSGQMTKIGVYRWQSGMKAISVRVVDGKVIEKAKERL